MFDQQHWKGKKSVWPESNSTVIPEVQSKHRRVVDSATVVRKLVHCFLTGMHDAGFLPVSDTPIFSNSFWQTSDADAHIFPTKIIKFLLRSNQQIAHSYGEGPLQTVTVWHWCIFFHQIFLHICIFPFSLPHSNTLLTTKPHHYCLWCSITTTRKVVYTSSHLFLTTDTHTDADLQHEPSFMCSFNMLYHFVAPYPSNSGTQMTTLVVSHWVSLASLLLIGSNLHTKALYTHLNWLLW